MNKANLVDAIAAQRNMSKSEVQIAVDLLLDLIGEGLAKGEKIDLRGFGTFAVRESAARTGRNPQTGEPLQIAARKVPAFRPGKELKERVNR